MGITVGRLTPRWPRWPKVALVTRETLPSTPRLSTECSTPDPASPDPRPSALSTASSPAHCPAALLLHPCPQIEVFGRKFEKSQMGGDKHGVYWQQQQPDIFASHPPTSNIECRQPLHPPLPPDDPRLLQNKFEKEEEFAVLPSLARPAGPGGER